MFRSGKGMLLRACSRFGRSVKNLRSAFADDVAFIGYLGEVNLRVNALTSLFPTLSFHLETEERRVRETSD